MDTLSYQTISANKATVTKEWVIVDATDQVLGRLGAKVAQLLRGKYKPCLLYTSLQAEGRRFESVNAHWKFSFEGGLASDCKAIFFIR